MNNNMQDILNNYYASGGRELFESLEHTEQLEEGVFTTAMVFAGLAALLSGGPKTEPVDKIDTALKSEITQVMGDIADKEKSLDAYEHDPQYIADMFGLPLESVIHPKNSKEFGKPVAGYDPADDKDVLAPSRLAKKSVQVDYSKRLGKNKLSPTYTTGGYTINVLRSSTTLKETMLNPDMDLKETVYLSTCLIEATQIRDNNKYQASKLIQFYHVYSGAIDSLQKCRPDMMVKALETAFKTNPVLIDPNRP